MSKKKTFLHIPEYPGGKEEFRKYIKQNLRYPQSAIDNKVSGTVYLTAEINDNGDVLTVTVTKGIGFGCDEEATRLIENIKFGGVKNRGLRLKTTKKFRIKFELPKEHKKSIHYNLVPSKNTTSEKQGSKNYSYSIKINRSIQ